MIGASFALLSQHGDGVLLLDDTTVHEAAPGGEPNPYPKSAQVMSTPKLRHQTTTLL